jgi:hypothetical protein
MEMVGFSPLQDSYLAWTPDKLRGPGADGLIFQLPEGGKAEPEAIVKHRVQRV